MNIVKKLVKGCVVVLGLALCAGCSFLPKANQIKGLESASAAIAVVQALDCNGIKTAVAVAAMKPEIEAFDCDTVKAILAASQALVQQQKATLQK